MKTLLLLYFVSLSAFLSAQKKISVAGVVTDYKKETVAGANVALYTTDSLLVFGETTKGDGTFKLFDVAKGTYFLKISYIGYKTEIIQLANVSQNIMLRNITLQEDRLDLKGLEVIANQRTEKVDRLIIYPNQAQLKISATSLDLLSEMMLPGLQINTVERNATAFGKEVEFRINGRKVTESEVEALLPKEVLRLEYIDNPGLEYNANLGAVIDYITKKNESGFVSSVNMTNATFTGFGNDAVNAKWNHKHSEFGLNYNVNYRSYSNRRTDSEEKYIYPDNSFISRDQIGENTPFRQQTHRINLNYNLSKPSDYLFSVIARTSIKKERKQFSSLIVSNITEDVRQQNSENTHDMLPELDIYYSKTISPKQRLNVNIVGSYSDSDYKRRYEESGDNYAYESLSDVEGSRYSLIAEVQYTNQLSKTQTLSAGVKEEYFWEKDWYLVQDEIVKTNRSYLYMYSQLTGLVKKVNYNVGIAASSNTNKQPGNNFAFWVFRPSLSVNYKIDRLSSLRYMFQIFSESPNVAYLNNIEQTINPYLLIKGNPGLRPDRKYFNTLTYSFSYKKFNAQLRGQYIYLQNPIMDYSFHDANRNMFVTSYKNQGNMQAGLLSLNLKYGPMLNNMVTLMVNGHYKHYRSKGDNYLHKLDNFNLQAQGTLAYKKVSLQLMATTREKELYGEKVNYNEIVSTAVIQYTKQPFIIGLGMYYPFSKHWDAGSTSLSTLIPQHSWRYIEDNGHMLFVKFAWNFLSGRKYKAANRELENQGGSSGFLTAPSED